VNKEIIIESVALYWPIVMSAVLYHCLKACADVNTQRVLTAGMMASAWVAATLPWINELCVTAGLWRFQVGHVHVLLSLPLSLYLGWIVLWGMLPALLLHYVNHRVWAVVLMFLLIDILTMGLFEPVMLLTPWYWLIGELGVLVFCLFPAVYLAKWVILQECVAWRASLISIAFIVLILWVVPSCVARFKIDYAILWNTYSLLEKCFWSLLLVLVSIPGVSGVMEFVRIGRGTPIPYDAPTNLVMTGVYSYVRNPMQLSMVLVLLVWSVIFCSWLVAGLAVGGILYSAGIAKWSEAEDLEQRYGNKWLHYRDAVSLWKMQIRPIYCHKESARIYIDVDCAVCLPIGNWLDNRVQDSLIVRPADDWKKTGAGDSQSLQRVTYYDPNNKEVCSGVVAMARAFGHLNIAWAFLGWLIMLPGLCWLIQLAIDVGGGGRVRKS